MSTSSPTDQATEATPQPPALVAADRPISALDSFSSRSRTHRSRGYSRIVGALRIILPLLAIAILVLQFGWSDVTEVVTDAPPAATLPAEEQLVEFEETVGGLDDDSMANPSFSGLDDDAQPYSVTGAVARRTASGSAFEIEEPVAEITLADGGWLALTASQALYEEGAERLRLNGAVNIFRDDGYSIVTDEVNLDMGSRRAWGDRPVLAHGPAGEISAQGFRIDQGAQAIVFIGNARIRLRPAGSGDPDDPDVTTEGDGP